jgi:hypothetical protein
MKRRGRRRAGRTPREKALQRRSRHRPAKTRILIVGEGRETESNYFRGLRLEPAVQQKFVIVVKKGKGGSCLAAVQRALTEAEKAMARGEEFDEVWCVFDVERAGQREQVIEAQTLARQCGICLAISNPSFEVWLLASFVRTRRSFADANEVIKELNKHWRRQWDQDYAKNDEQVYERLADRIRTAIANARTVREQDWAASAEIVDCNSATDVYRLVERLLGPLG